MKINDAGQFNTYDIGLAKDDSGLLVTFRGINSRLVIADSLVSCCTIRSSDMQPIYSLDSGLRINPCTDVIIRDHVWLAQDSMILKGARVPADSVVAARSVVTSSSLSGLNDPGVVHAGSPAKVVVSRCTWEKNLAQKFRGPWSSDLR
jgi:acetyltransferase-like isoleucine patch superfamily enzyme